MCFTITHNIYVTVTWNYVNGIWLNLLESYDTRNIQKLSQTKNDKKLVNVTRIILVDITESHDFVDLTNYL